MNLNIIVPPGQGGVRDFAYVLANAMRHEPAVQVISWRQDGGREITERSKIQGQTLFSGNQK